MKVCPKCQKTFEATTSFCPLDGEVLQEQTPGLVGQLIDGKYLVESFIAQGGMGALYRAHHTGLDDQVVIKTLRPEMRSNTEWLKRFQREGKAARRFRHPNAVIVYDLSTTTDGLIYMVMEFVEGHTLDRELKARGRFSPREALDILEPVADVLDAAHAAGVIHRDLKPENVMLGAGAPGRPTIKVLDLGIAKMVGVADAGGGGDAASLTVAGQILGTPYYMSPEQWGELPRDGNSEIDGRTDIYSLGVIFYELVAGRKPRGGRTLAEIRRDHVVAPLAPLHDVAPGVPPAFSRAVERAMAKDRADRYQTAGEFVDDVRSALGLQPVARRRAEAGGDAHDAGAAGESLPAASEALTASLPQHAGTSAREDGDRGATLLTSDLPAPAYSDARETAAPVADPSTSAHVAGATAGPDRRRAAAEPDEEATALAQQRRHDGGAPASGAGQAEAVRAGAATPGGLLKYLVVGGALALALVAAGMLFMWSRSSGVGTVGEANANAAARTSPTVPAAAPRVEAVSYWLELIDSPKQNQTERVADPSLTLASKQRFKIHFRAPQRGYLYIVGHGAGGNALTTFLTAQGAGPLKSNQLPADADFAFPFGKTRGGGDILIVLDDNPGTDVFTVIFSPTPLLEPAFLTREYGHQLTPAEVRELEDLRTRYKSNAPALAARGEGSERVVSVTVPDAETKNDPLVFDIRINHK